jgi:hypothetical protein
VEDEVTERAATLQSSSEYTHPIRPYTTAPIRQVLRACRRAPSAGRYLQPITMLFFDIPRGRPTMHRVFAVPHFQRIP